jgi:hypothetical protein
MRAATSLPAARWQASMKGNVGGARHDCDVGKSLAINPGTASNLALGQWFLTETLLFEPTAKPARGE